jgi:hypothetical protein
VSRPVKIPADLDHPDRVLAGLTARQVVILASTALLIYAGWLATRPVLPVLVFVVLAWLAFGTQLRSRFETVSLRSAIDNARFGGEANSFGWRMVNWRGLIEQGMNHPFTGHGAGMTTHLNRLIAVNGVPFNAHNDFVRFFFEGGIFGLACYVIYGLLLCRWAASQSRMRGVASMAIAASLASLLFLTGGTPEISLHTASLYALYAMLAMANVPSGASAEARSARAPVIVR